MIFKCQGGEPPSLAKQCFELYNYHYSLCEEKPCAIESDKKFTVFGAVSMKIALPTMADKISKWPGESA